VGDSRAGPFRWWLLRRDRRLGELQSIDLWRPGAGQVGVDDDALDEDLDLNSSPVDAQPALGEGTERAPGLDALPLLEHGRGVVLDRRTETRTALHEHVLGALVGPRARACGRRGRHSGWREG